jgi:hypothetical protein
MGSVPGLNEAIRLCDSDTTTQRKQGRKSLEEIFSNRQNIELFGARAAQNNGAGWVQLFQVLFNGVLTEKRATAAKKGGAAGKFSWLLLVLFAPLD